jgi:hypothetical protein
MTLEQLEMLNQLVIGPKLYMFLGGLALFASAAGAYAAGYFAKRAEIRAINAEIKTLIAQNTQLTDAMEVVIAQNTRLTDAMEAVIAQNRQITDAVEAAEPPWWLEQRRHDLYVDLLQKVYKITLLASNLRSLVFTGDKKRQAYDQAEYDKLREEWIRCLDDVRQVRSTAALIVGKDGLRELDQLADALALSGAIEPSYDFLSVVMKTSMSAHGMIEHHAIQDFVLAKDS